MKPTLHVLSGLPGSGKSTQREKMIDDDTRVVCPDDIRNDLYGYGNKGVFLRRSLEEEVWKIAHAKVVAFLKLGKNVIFDATNLTKKRRAPLVSIAKDQDAIVKCTWLMIDPIISLVRNDGREKHVPSNIILRMFADSENPTKEEGFDSIEFINQDGTHLEWRKYYKDKDKYIQMVEDATIEFKEDEETMEQRLRKLKEVKF